MSERWKIRLVASLASIGMCLAVTSYLWFGDVTTSVRSATPGDVARLAKTAVSPQLSAERRALAADVTAPTHERVAVIGQLAADRDWDATETLLSMLDDPSPIIRGKAANALRAILGTEFFFHADDPLSKRREVIAGMQRYWESRQLHPPTK